MPQPRHVAPLTRASPQACTTTPACVPNPVCQSRVVASVHGERGLCTVGACGRGLSGVSASARDEAGGRGEELRTMRAERRRGTQSGGGRAARAPALSRREKAEKVLRESQRGGGHRDREDAPAKVSARGDEIFFAKSATSPLTLAAHRRSEKKRRLHLSWRAIHFSWREASTRAAVRREAPVQERGRTGWRRFPCRSFFCSHVGRRS